MSVKKRIEELYGHRGRKKSLDCKDSQNGVLAYIRASKEERKSFAKDAVTDAFAHIYWCINTKTDCADVWRTLKFIKQYPGSPIEDGIARIAEDPAILNGCDEEIQALLVKWEREVEKLEKNAWLDLLKLFGADGNNSSN